MPGISKETTILPLKIAGKPPEVTSSYRPISPTSCVVTTMERMLRTACTTLPRQVGGFKVNRLASLNMDQILRITQTTCDGCQVVKSQRSLMALLLAVPLKGLTTPFAC